MAETKKATVKATVDKAEVKAPEIKAEEVKPVKEKAAEVKKEAAKPAAKKTAVRKPAAKTAAKKPAAKKTAVIEVVNFQFEGKSYTQEDLVKIAKDVWKYDLKMKAVEFKSVELYVKPEESLAYYVINGDVTGSFLI